MKEKINLPKEKGRKSKKLISLLTLLIAAAFVTAVWLGFYDDPLDGLRNTFGKKETPFTEGITVTFADVGQGDCALLTCENGSMLIDAGVNGTEDEVFRVLDSAGIGKLNVIFISHPHSDHIGALPEVLENYGAEKLIVSFDPTDDVMIEAYAGVVSLARSYRCEVLNLGAGDSFSVGGAKADILGPVTENAEDFNNMSAILKVVYGKNSFLFTGDAAKEEELSVLESGAQLKSDVLKVGHHGSSGSSCESFLDAVSPEICVISVGAGNDYGHPAESLLRRLKGYTERIYRTDVSGSVTLEGDGKIIRCK